MDGEQVIFNTGSFVSPENYCWDDFAPYPAGDLDIFDGPQNRGAPRLLTGTVQVWTNNYGSDDFESEAAGTVGTLHHSVRSGDTLLKNGKFF
jgi:hypothetical protein